MPALRTSLVAHWKFDESSGNAADSFGSNTLTNTNTATYTAGKRGNAGTFAAASSQYFTIASNTDLRTGDIDVTWGVWVKLTTKTVTRMVFGKWQASGNYEYVLYYDQAADRFTFAINTNGTNQFISVAANNLGAPSTGVYYYLQCGYNAATDLMFINGNAGTANTASRAGGMFLGTSPLQVGRNDDGDTSYWDGQIDELSMWKRILTTGENRLLYNGGDGLTYEDWDSAEYAETIVRRSTAAVPELPYQRKPDPTPAFLLTGGVPSASEWQAEFVKFKNDPPPKPAQPAAAFRGFPPFLLTGGVVTIDGWTAALIRLPKPVQPSGPAKSEPYRHAWMFDLNNVGPRPPGGLEKNKARSMLHRVPQYAEQRRIAHALDVLHEVVNSLVGAGLLLKDDLASWTLRSGAHVETRAPGAMDDSQTGFPVGCQWVNSVTRSLYVCVDNTNYAAVWRGPI